MKKIYKSMITCFLTAFLAIGLCSCYIFHSEDKVCKRAEAWVLTLAEAHFKTTGIKKGSCTSSGSSSIVKIYVEGKVVFYRCEYCKAFGIGCYKMS